MSNRIIESLTVFKKSKPMLNKICTHYVNGLFMSFDKNKK